MMCVKSRVDKSNLHGFGVFAEEFIAKDTVIWKFSAGLDIVIKHDDLSKLPENNKNYLLRYTYQCDDEYVLAIDDGRYMNHSDSPNTYGAETDDGYGMTVAARDIAKGEEITSDYFEFDDDFERKKTENPFV